MDNTMKEIPEFPNYCVTEDGRVWSERRKSWLALCDNGDGYLYVCLRNNGQAKRNYAHRLVLQAFIGPCPRGMECRHLDGDPANNRLSNLKWGTSSENHKDAVRHGTSPFGKGKNNAQVKLTEEQVRLIFNAYHDGAYNRQELADYFEVSWSQVNRIVKKKRWGHLWHG
jgi:hypothetical protein